MIDLLERVALHFEREESPQQKLSKLEGFLVQYGLPLAEAVPLFATLLSLPLPADYAPLTMSPEQQKQKTLHALLTILLRIAAQQPVLFVMEDLHWVDPTTLELLSLLVDQGPTAASWRCGPFGPTSPRPGQDVPTSPRSRSHRLPRRQAVEMTRQVAHGKALPPEVVEQVVAKTDGVPLFVEELTKMVLESGLLQEREERYELTRSPAPAGDSRHAARLADGTAGPPGNGERPWRNSGRRWGASFPMSCCRPSRPGMRATLRRGLQQLVEAEFLYQQGLPPQATYRFKHALIQEAAYQSLLRSTRQRHHQHIAQVLEAQLSRDSARRSPSCSRITTPRRASASRPWAIGSAPASAPSNARPMWKR